MSEEEELEQLLEDTNVQVYKQHAWEKEWANLKSQVRSREEATGEEKREEKRRERRGEERIGEERRGEERSE